MCRKTRNPRRFLELATVKGVTHLAAAKAPRSQPKLANLDSTKGERREKECPKFFK
ncbi:hypothetical protein GBA52_009249 [Prunus armeniaca]|nr:hypothetical protein GBA52_009249 [Prunus armeniaca]